MAEQAVSLAAFLPADTFDLEIVAADGATPTGWTITLAGPSHPQTVAAAENVARKSLRRAAKVEAAQINGRKFQPEEHEPADLQREHVEIVASRILGWNPIDIGNGPIAFSREAAVDLFLNPAMGWAYGQVLDALSSTTAFTRRSASN